MKRENVVKIATVVTALAILGALVVGEFVQQEYTVYLPIVYAPRESLKSEFAEHGIRSGFAVSSYSFENPITRAIIEEHAAVVTTENALKMYATQPQQGVFDFNEADAIVAYADELGIGVHGHTASWAGQNPDWLVNGDFSRSELEYILSNHVSTLSNHYEGKLISLDTANEAYASSGGLLCGPWCPLGGDYVRLSFDIDTDYPVVYNSNFWYEDDPYHAIRLLEEGKADGIGIQVHCPVPGGCDQRLEAIDILLDSIRQHGGFARFSEIGVWAGSDEEQATIFAAITRLAIKHSDIVRDFVVWGVKDPAWRGDVTLFDSAGNPKPSYYAVMEELQK